MTTNQTLQNPTPRKSIELPVAYDSGTTLHSGGELGCFGVSISTNCPRGGDTGHGGISKFELSTTCSVPFVVRVNGKPVEADSVEIEVTGDWEASDLAQCLGWAGRALAEKQRTNIALEKFASVAYPEDSQ